MGIRNYVPGSQEYISGLCERLKIARTLVEPHGADAARHCDVDPRTWWRWEEGHRVPDICTLARFSIEYDIDPRWLLVGDPSGLRWPLVANLRLIPEAVKYLPDAKQEPAVVSFPENTRVAVSGTNRRTQLARQN